MISDTHHTHTKQQKKPLYFSWLFQPCDQTQWFVVRSRCQHTYHLPATKPVTKHFCLVKLQKGCCSVRYFVLFLNLQFISENGCHLVFSHTFPTFVCVYVCASGKCRLPGLLPKQWYTRRLTPTPQPSVDLFCSPALCLEFLVSGLGAYLGGDSEFMEAPLGKATANVRVVWEAFHLHRSAAFFYHARNHVQVESQLGYASDGNIRIARSICLVKIFTNALINRAN